MRVGFRQSGPLVLAGVLAILLIVLGTLQWRWLGQISADERTRMRASLRSRVEDFTQEFDRELTRAYFWLQVDRGPAPGVAAADSTDHFQRWFSTAPHPDMVRAIHVVAIQPGTDGASARARLSTYDRARDTLVPSVEQARLMHALTPAATMRILEGHGHSCLIAPDMDLAAIVADWMHRAAG